MAWHVADVATILSMFTWQMLNILHMALHAYSDFQIMQGGCRMATCHSCTHAYMCRADVEILMYSIASSVGGSFGRFAFSLKKIWTFINSVWLVPDGDSAIERHEFMNMNFTSDPFLCPLRISMCMIGSGTSFMPVLEIIYKRCNQKDCMTWLNIYTHYRT